MVSTLKSGLTNAPKSRPPRGQLLFPVCSRDAVALDQIELDFSDVFGPAPMQLSVEVNDDMGNAEASDLVYDDPVVVYSRSHSLVGPSSYVSQFLKLSMLSLRESEELVEFVERASEENHTESLALLSDDEKSSDLPKENPLGVNAVSIDDFEILKVVGQGAFGKVFQVRKKGTTDVYAMKVMRKDRIMEKNHTKFFPGHSCIPASYLKRQHFRLEFDPISRSGCREALARAYAAEIVSAVAHLHPNGIMHRDPKPDNMPLDADGHVVLTDFGPAKQFAEDRRSNSMCGTAEYMSREIVLGKGHGKPVGRWSVGVLFFEMLTGDYAN